MVAMVEWFRVQGSEFRVSDFGIHGVGRFSIRAKRCEDSTLNHEPSNLEPIYGPSRSDGTALGVGGRL